MPKELVFPVAGICNALFWIIKKETIFSKSVLKKCLQPKKQKYHLICWRNAQLLMQGFFISICHYCFVWFLLLLNTTPHVTWDISHVMCHLSHVTFHASNVTCHMSHVMCHMSRVIQLSSNKSDTKGTSTQTNKHKNTFCRGSHFQCFYCSLPQLSAVQEQSVPQTGKD